MGAEILRMARSIAFRFSGFFMFARMKKKGTARRTMTIATSR
jgi:hypothetical protein